MNISEERIFHFLTKISVNGTFVASSLEEKILITSRFVIFIEDESNPSKNANGGLTFKNVKLSQEGKEYIIRKAFISIQNTY